MSYDQIIRNALRLAKAPRRFASGGEVVPKKMGTSPIPKGMVRRFHVTGSQNIDDIKKNGITMQKARGIEGPKAIYSWPDEDGARSYAGPSGAIVEFYDHSKNYDSHPYARLGDVPKDQILAIHEPWHESYRYALEENIPSKELRDAGGPDYEKAADALDKSRGYALGGEADPKDISPSISNPVSVFPKPQRMFPSDAPVPGGQYLGMPDKQDMTGHKSAVASIGVHPGGKPYFNASKDAVDQTGTAGKAKTKTNLFKQKAGWSWQNAPEGHEETNTIVSVEHLGKHYYALNAHFPKGVDFARYEKAQSEPRLRPTTTGDVFLGPQAGTISVRGKEHPVYHHVVVKADGGAVGYASGGDVDQPRQLDDRGFYSAAAEAARSLPQAKGSPSQMMATMKGVKPSELEWSGAGNAFADQKTVTRDDLAQHFEKNTPKITETIFGKKIDPEILRKRQEIADMYLPEFKKYLNIGDIMQENYHPDDMVRDAALQEAVRIQDKMREHMDREAPLPYQKPTRYKDWTLGNSYGNETPSQRGYREILLRLDHPDTLHQSSHWDDPNVIAHLRMQDRGIDNDVLHLEELQSDWAQEGRDKGFLTLERQKKNYELFKENEKLIEEQFKLEKKLRSIRPRTVAYGEPMEYPNEYSEELEAELTKKIKEIRNKVRENSNYMSDSLTSIAPYVTNTDHWTELALKRALIEAARGGYNKLVWTPGEEQAKRYRLGNYVDTLLYRTDQKKLIGYDKKRIVFLKDDVEENDLKNYLGKELADKIMHEDNAVKRFNGEKVGHSLEGQQLFIGGTGMKKYYGEILPNALRRVLKPHTDKIQPTSHVVKNNDGEDVTLPGIEITPEMRESILKKGFAHYAHGGEVRQHFEVGGGADGGDSGGGDSSNGDGGGFSSNSDMADFGSQTEREDSSPAAPSYSPTDQDPSMLGGATGMAFSPLGSGSLGVGTGRVSGSVFGNAEQNLNTGPGVVGFIGGSPLGALAYAMEQINNTYYDGKARADVDQNVGGPSSGQNPTAADVVYPQSANPSGGFRLSSDDDETQAGMVKPVAFAPPAPPMMASGGKARNSHPVLSIPGVHIREEIHGRPIFLGEEFGKFSSGGDVPKNKNEGIIVSDNHKGKIPDVNYLVKNKNRFIYHSSPADPNDLKHGIDPMSAESGTWTSENMDSEDYGMSESEYEEYKESLPKASWYSRKPEWVKTIAARKLGKHENELMEDDIKNHGHLALVHKKDLKDYNIYWVGDDFHHTEEVTDPYGKRKKVWSTPLHSYSDIFGNLTVPGIEENEYVSTDSIEPFVQLTGDALVEFLKKTGNL